MTSLGQHTSKNTMGQMRQICMRTASGARDLKDMNCVKMVGLKMRRFRRHSNNMHKKLLPKTKKNIVFMSTANR